LTIPLLTSCGEAKDLIPEIDAPERRGQVASPVDFEFVDTDPSLSADGQNIVFLSGRQKVSKAFKYQIGQSEDAQRLTNEDLGVENAAVLSPSGEVVALVTTNDGKSTLYAQSYATDSARTKVAEIDGVWDFNVALSPGTSPFIAFYQKDADGNRTIALSQITVSGGAITVSTPVELPEFTEGEKNPKFQAADSGFSVVTMLNENGARTFFKRTFTDTTLSGTKSEIVSGIEGSLNESYALSKTGLVTTRSLSKRKKLTAVSDKAEKDKVTVNVKAEGIKIADSDGAISTIDQPLVSITHTAAVQTDSEVLLLATEYFNCENFKDWGSGLHLITASGSNRLLMVKGEEKWELSLDSCGKFVAKAKKQPVNFQITNSSITKNGSTYAMVVQSWYDKDPEIFHFSFEISNGEAANVVASEVSNNPVR
jgi:hypothetical protein